MRVLLRFRSGFAGLREGFEALGHEVVDEPAAADLCVADFVDCARRIRDTLALKRRLAARGTPFVALSRDAPWHRGVSRNRLLALALLKPFDGYAAHSMQEGGRFARRTLYCPNAARESLYRASAAELAAMREAAWYRWDVSFLGNVDTRRYPEHRKRAAFLAALRERLAPLGVSALIRDAAGLSEPEQLDIIRRSRINLSTFVAADAGAEPCWGLPERCYGVPACGGLLLSDRRKHAPEDFAADEWADYDGIEHCVARIREFLKSPASARALAERAHARVMREHCYRHRAARLVDFAANAR